MATVKMPKWKKATGTEGAISVKGGAYPVKGTGVGGGKVRGEVSKSNTGTRKRSDGVIITRTGPNKYPKMTKEQKSNIGKQQLQIMKTRELLSKKMKVTKAKKPVTTGKKVAVAAVAAAAANVRGPAGKSVKVKGGTKPGKWRNSKRVGRTRVASRLRSEYDPKTDQWIKYTD